MTVVSGGLRLRLANGLLTMQKSTWLRPSTIWLSISAIEGDRREQQHFDGSQPGHKGVVSTMKYRHAQPAIMPQAQTIRRSRVALHRYPS
mgnify:CR=1 FL=1